jgi:hypothetical protein
VGWELDFGAALTPKSLLDGIDRLFDMMKRLNVNPKKHQDKL